MKNIFFLLFSLHVFAQIDVNYPEIDDWQLAGVIGGIPKNQDLYATIDTTADLQAVMFSAFQWSLVTGDHQIINLSDGVYDVAATSGIDMYSGVVLNGQSRNGTIIYSDEVFADGGGYYQEKPIIEFDNDSYSGIQNLTVQYYGGCPLNIVQDFWTEMGFNNYHTNSRCGGSTDIKLVRMQSSSNNNWIVNCNLYDSGTHSIHIDEGSTNNTIANSRIDGAYKTATGGEGYLLVTGDYNLIIYNKITRLRHYSIERNADHNVTYGNIIEVDVNFHDGDDGYNLVEQNIVTPHLSGFGPIQTGRNCPQTCDYGHSPPSANGNYIYNNNIYNKQNTELRLEDQKTNVYQIVDYMDPDSDQITDFGYAFDTIVSPLPLNDTFYPLPSTAPSLSTKRVLVYYNNSGTTESKKQLIGGEVERLSKDLNKDVVHDNLGYCFTTIDALDKYYDKIFIVNESALTFTSAQQAALDAFSGDIYYLDDTLSDNDLQSLIALNFKSKSSERIKLSRSQVYLGVL